MDRGELARIDIETVELGGVRGGVRTATLLLTFRNGTVIRRRYEMTNDATYETLRADIDGVNRELGR